MHGEPPGLIEPQHFIMQKNRIGSLGSYSSIGSIKIIMAKNHSLM